MSISADNLHALSAFASIAGEYCAFIDSLRESRPPNLYSRLEELLPRLHRAILPVRKEMARRKHRKFEKLEMTQDQWSELAKAIGEIVGKESEALFEWHGGTKPDPNEVEKYCSTRAGMLWDDLTDIYRDLHHGLSLWQLDNSDAQAEAAWQWRFNYEAHWGDHLFRAMTTVHEARYQLFVD